MYRVWGIRPAKICEASKLQSLFGASRLKASKPQSCKASLAPHASKPQSSKASLAPHASKPQSCKASLAPHASKPQSLNAWMPWRFGAWRLFQALALLGAFPTPQSLKAWTLGCCGALALGGSCTLWRFLTLFRRLKASKPERLDALALRRVSYASKPQSLNAWMLWRFGAWRSWCFGASWPFGALRLFDALALWRLALLMLWCLLALWRFAALWRFGASWRFETSRLCDALALCGSLRHAILEKTWFCRFYFFCKHRLKHRYKSCFGEKTKGQIVCIWGPALTCSQRTYDYLFSNFCGLFNDGLP